MEKSQKIAAAPQANQVRTWYLHILECDNGNYYVGIAQNYLLRFWQHQHGKGARYTRKNLPRKIFSHLKLGNMTQWEAEQYENAATLLVMARVGTYKVCGGKFFQTRPTKKYDKRIIKETRRFARFNDEIIKHMKLPKQPKLENPNKKWAREVQIAKMQLKIAEKRNGF